MYKYISPETRRDIIIFVDRGSMRAGSAYAIINIASLLHAAERIIHNGKLSVYVQ